jgi:hypothetical protein
VHANLHVVLQSGEHWINNLAVKVYLHDDASARPHYAEAKQEAIEVGAASLLSYPAAKIEIVSHLLQEVLAAQQTR